MLAKKSARVTFAAMEPAEANIFFAPRLVSVMRGLLTKSYTAARNSDDKIIHK